MAYNFRPRLLREELLAMQYDEADFGGEMSSDEEDNVSEFDDDFDIEQEGDRVEERDSNSEQDELDTEMENAPRTKRMREREIEKNELDETPLSKRLQPHRRSRSIPQSKLYGKSVKGGKKFVWSTNPSTRHFGKLYVYLARIILERVKVYDRCRGVLYTG